MKNLYQEKAFLVGLLVVLCSTLNGLARPTKVVSALPKLNQTSDGWASRRPLQDKKLIPSSDVRVSEKNWLVANTVPTITGTTISRQQGSDGTIAVIATVDDAETLKGNLTVTAAAPFGIEVASITNVDGLISATVRASCFIDIGPQNVTLTVKDGDGATATATLVVDVQVNTTPTLTYSNQVVSFNGSKTITPATGPSDNGEYGGGNIVDQEGFTGDISINPNTGVIEISNAAPVGTFLITVNMLDNCEESTTTTFTLTVGNSTPTITGTTISRQQGSDGTVAVIATVDDIETLKGDLTVTADAPSGIVVSSITNVNGVISATVRATCFIDIGPQNVTLTVKDGDGATATATLVVDVQLNTTPTLTYSNQTVSFNGSKTITPATGPSDNGEYGGGNIVDQEGFTGDISINPNTGVIEISNAAPVGTFLITVNMLDNCEESTKATFSLTVENTNPTITGATIVRQQGSSATSSVIATVDDGETLKGDLAVTATTVPTGITITGLTNANGSISAMVSASCTSTLGANTVVLTVTDGNGGSATANLTVNVTANTPPTLTYGNQTVSFNGSKTITPSTGPSDNGSYGGGLITDKGGFTGNISINPSTGVLEVSNAAPVGTFTISVRMLDNCEASTSTSFTITIGNTNPTITGATIVRQQGSSATSSVIATVDDGETWKGDLTVTATTVPTGITITGLTNANGSISAMVSASCTSTLGANTVVLTVTDGNGGSATANLTVNVTANTAPVLGYPNSSLNVSTSSTVTPTAGPSDNGSFGNIKVINQGTFTGTLAVDPSTGVITITDAAPVGTHTVVVSILDNCETATQTSFSLTVGGCLNPTLSFSTKTNPTTCGAADGSLIFITTNLADGTYPFSYSDGTSVNKTISVAGGVATLGGLKAGSYSNFVLTNSSCSGSLGSSYQLADPSAPNTGVVNGLSQLCVSAIAAYTTTGQAGGTWSSTDPALATIDALTGVVQAKKAGVVEIKYQLTNGGCSSTSAKTITINALPQAPTSGGVTPNRRCSSLEPVPMTSSVQCSAGQMLVWYPTAQGGSAVTLPSQTPLVSTDYYAACRVEATGCESPQRWKVSFTALPRGSEPFTASLTADGRRVAANDSASICDVAGNALVFSAACGADERMLISVDGGDYGTTLPLQQVDGRYHNYRVRCQAGAGADVCLGNESGPMRLRIYPALSKPSAQLSPQVVCSSAPTVPLVGNSNCGVNVTLWFDAQTNEGLSLPSQTPAKTKSYYVKCQSAAGCLSEASEVVTITVLPVQEAPLIINEGSDDVCKGATVTLKTTCPTTSTVVWNNTYVGATLTVASATSHTYSYSAKCIVGTCETPLSAPKRITWNAFDLTFINIGKSLSGTKEGGVVTKMDWASHFLLPSAGPSLPQSSQENPTLYYAEDYNKTAPRYWTFLAEACGLGENGSITFDMLVTPETGVPQSYNTHENNAPYLMYANRDGFRELYSPNHPAFGFYQDNGQGGNVYDVGLPKGLYKLSVRYWDQKGLGAYPSTRLNQGVVLAYEEFWFRIQSKNGVGVGVGAAREASSGQQVAVSGVQGVIVPPLGRSAARARELRGLFVLPNPVTNILRLQVPDSKGQTVQSTLTDASGREVLRRSFVPETNSHQEEFGVSDLTNGVYFLRVQTENTHGILKVIKAN